MRVYLIRHGQASQKAMDEQCALTEVGQREVQQIAHFLKKQAAEVSHIFHSGKLRAKQTAEIIAASLKLSNKVEFHPGLHPMDSVVPIAAELNQASSDLMWVGHMPFMGKLVSYLIAKNENADIAGFHTASVVCLERIQHDFWMIHWVIYPELLN